MAVNANNVFVGAPDQLTTGAILTAPVNADHPKGIRDAIPAEAVDTGYISEDGLKLTPTRNTEDIKDWSGAVIRRILTDFDGVLEWAHLELNEASLKNYLGDDNVEVTPATTTHGTELAGKFNGDELPIKAWYFKMKDGPRRILIVAPRGQVTEQTELEFVKSGAVTPGVKLSCYPDELGNSIYIYTTDGVIAGSNPVPAVTDVEPNPEAAGEQVTITGTTFLGATSVKFGATEADDFTVIDSRTIVAIVPAGAAGAANVTVTTPSGTSQAAPFTRA